MSERQKQAHWVQNIIHNPSVLLTVEEKIFEGTVRLIDQEEVMGAKYKWDRGLIVEIIPN